MKLDDILNIGEICEVSGRKVKAGVYVNKNADYLNFEGNVIKNVGIGAFVIIKKGFVSIVGRVDGEYMKDPRIEEYSFSKEVKRFISIDILGTIDKDNFVAGLRELPSIGNNVYIATDEINKTVILDGNTHPIIIGKLIEDNNYPFIVDAQELFCSHIGIFGNTGSGKSNTLAKIYNELINAYSKHTSFINNTCFCVFDFNGEYINVFENAKHYYFSTKTSNEDNENKFCLSLNDIMNIDFWSIIFNATEKTQKPFINRSIKYFYKLNNGKKTISTRELSEMILNLNTNYVDCKYYIKEIFNILADSNIYDKLEEKLFVNGKYSNLYMKQSGRNQEYEISIDTFEKEVFGKSKEYDFNIIDSFNKIELSLLLNYCIEIGKAYISKEHVGPMMSRIHNRIEDLSNLFYISSENCNKQVIEVFHLNDLKIEFKKIVPLIICKKYYDEKKQKHEEKKSLHLIIDEAHNILSTESIRESEEWKDYRLETFEEIIKEGRKFNTFLTISSQRPSDISDTIISQLHNYFIHRLVNEEDLRKIKKTVAFNDEKTNEMISILPAGGCIFSGTATNFPMLVQIDILQKDRQPSSQIINIDECWTDIGVN